jgi:hypothetical protein
VAPRNGNLLLERLSMRKGGLESLFLLRARGVAQGCHRAVAPQSHRGRLPMIMAAAQREVLLDPDNLSMRKADDREGLVPSGALIHLITSPAGIGAR